MNRFFIIFGVLLKTWSSFAAGYSCQDVSGLMPNRPGRTIEMIPTQLDPSRFEGSTTTRDGQTKVKITISPIKKPGLWTEGDSKNSGVEVILSVDSTVETRPGENTIAVTTVQGRKAPIDVSDLKLTVLGKVTENSWVKVICQGQ